MLVRSRSPLLLLTVACSLILLAGCSRQGHPRDQRLMVMNFENSVPCDKSKDYGPALAEIMTANLTNYSRVAVIERQNKAKLFVKAQAQPDQWRKLGRKAGADYLVVGAISKLNGNYILTTRLWSVALGDVIKGSSIQRTCKRDEDIYPVVQAMCRMLAGQVKTLAEMEEGSVAAHPTPVSTASANTPPPVMTPAPARAATAVAAP